MTHTRWTPPIRLALAAVALVVAVGPGWATNLVRCTSKAAEAVTISFDAKRLNGRSLSCISGDFISDLTPCAPKGGFGLSAPTGSAALVAIADRWQDYASHMGSVTGFTEQPEAMSFTGGFNSADSGLSDRWTFTVDRVTGHATLKQDGKPDASFVCTKVKAKV